MKQLLPDTSKLAEAAVPFQAEDAAFFLANKKVVFGHKTGLGKTFMSILGMSQVPSAELQRVLIVGSLSSIGVWRRELKRWAGADSVFMKGFSDPDWAKFERMESGIYICTYATLRILLKDRLMAKKLRLDLLICDELHKSLRSRNTTYREIKKLQFSRFIGLTATWASKGPQDLWPVLNLMDPEAFPSYWRFINTFCHVGDGSFGKQIFGAKNAEGLRNIMRKKYYRTRTWAEAAPQFRKDGSTEAIIRRSLILPMDPTQQILHDQMRERKEVRYKGQMVLAQNSLTAMLRGLQLSLSPQLLLGPEAPVGSLVQYLYDKIEGQDAVTIFLPYKDLASICAKYFKASGYTGEMYFLYGGIDPDDCMATIDDWKKKKGIIFCTISYAQSFALDIADNAYFLGFDWDPNNNVQAEGRMRRLDSVSQVPCVCTYLVPEMSDYEKVREVINGKVETVKQVLAEYGK